MISPKKSFWFTSGMATVSFVGLALEVLNIESPVLACLFLGIALCFALWAFYSYREGKKKFSYKIYSQIVDGGSVSGEDVIREIVVKASLHSDKKFNYLNTTLTELQGVDNSLSVGSVLLGAMRNVKPNTIRDTPIFQFRPLVNELEIVTREDVLKRQIKRNTEYFFSIQLATKLFIYKKLSFFMKVDSDGSVDVNPTEVIED